MLSLGLAQDTQLAEFRQRAHELIEILRNGASERWGSWLESSCQTTVKELNQFAMTLQKDAAAVYEASQQAWSNSATEGHVNRLKFIKRQMYGRASFDWLRIRVLLAN